MTCRTSEKLSKLFKFSLVFSKISFYKNIIIECQLESYYFYALKVNTAKKSNNLIVDKIQFYHTIP